MANESGGGGGGKYRGRKRKSGVRKSSITSPRTGLGGILGIGGDSPVADPSIGNWLNNIMQGAANNISGQAQPGPGALQSLLSSASDKFGGGPSGGVDMTNIAPQVTMEAKRPKVELDNNAATGYDPMQQFMDLATSMLTDPGAASFDYETAQREAAGAIRQAYGAEIAAIRQNNRVARKSSKAARKEIDHLYRGLAKMYGRQEKRAVRQGDKMADRQMGIAEEGNTILQDLNNQMINDEAALLQKIGGQDAYSEIVSPDFDRMGQQVAENTEQGQAAAQRANRMGQNNARWFDRAQAGARFEGVDTQGDMIGQLQNYLMNNRNQIAGLKGDRAQEIAASNMNIEAQAAEAAGESQQQTFDNVLKLLGMTADIEDTNADNARADAGFRWDKKMDRKNLRLKMMDAAESGSTDSLKNYSPGIQDAMSIIAQNQDAGDSKATEALWKLFSSNAWRTGEVVLPGNAGETAPLTPYEAAARARKVGRNLGLQGRELQEFINAAAASVR